MIQRGQESSVIKALIAVVILGFLAFLVLSPTVDLFNRIGSVFKSYQNIDSRILVCNGFSQQDVAAASYCDVNTQDAVSLNERGEYVSCLYLSSLNKVNPASYPCAKGIEEQARETCQSLVTAKKITSERVLESTRVNGKTCRELGVTLK